MTNEDSTDGWLITRRESLRIPAVSINACTQPGGSITAEILDRQNKVLPGFSRDECIAFQGDSVRHLLRWKAKSFPTNSTKSDYKIRFWLNQAEIFSYLPESLDPNQRDLARFPNTGP